MKRTVMTCGVLFALAAGPAAAQEAATSDGAITLTRLAVCERVEDRAPIGEAESFQGVRKLWCFTRVEGARTPTRVYHRWYVGDRMVNEIPINVKGPRWRCWSQKTILPSWKGACRVEVATEEGDILGTKTFTLAAGDEHEGHEHEAEKHEAEKHEGDKHEGDEHEGHNHD